MWAIGKDIGEVFLRLTLLVPTTIVGGVIFMVLGLFSGRSASKPIIFVFGLVWVFQAGCSLLPALRSSSRFLGLVALSIWLYFGSTFIRQPGLVLWVIASLGMLIALALNRMALT